MLQVSNLKKSYGQRVLFENLTFSLTKGEVCGLVGRNGSGKSTLFKILLGQETYDDGEIVTPKGYRLGQLDQHIRFSKPTLLEECVQVLNEEEKFDHYRAERILFGLGFGEEDLKKDPRQFSGGYQLRINLTKALLQNPDLLLLDEPTNYLDIVSLRWLRRFLKTFPGEVMIITHDREFMDSVTTHTMGIHRKTLRRVKGDTEKFYQQLVAEEEIYEKTRRNQERKIKEMQAFVDRFRAKASRAKQAQSRLKQIEKLSILKALDVEITMGLKFHYQPTPAKTLLEVENLGFSFSGKDDEFLFKDLSFHLKPCECLAVIGKNGKGKTTLLNVLAGLLPPSLGQIRAHPATAIGYYQQTNRKDLDPKNSVVKEIALANEDLSLSQVRAICGAMMFSGDDAEKKISVLSGGEQGRVLLGKILATPTNLLLLDEPSNHLDMDSIEVLTEELSEFPGGVIIVTHNEEMLRRLATRLIVFRHGGAEVFLGTYDEFLEKMGWEEEGVKSQQEGSSLKLKADPKQVRRQRAALITERAKKLKPLESQLEETEARIQELENEMEAKNQAVMELISQQNEGNGQQIQELYKSIGSLQLEIESAFGQMEKLLYEIEVIRDEFDRRLKEPE